MRQVRAARREPLPEPIADPVEAARAAGLRYVTDAAPGIRRKRAGKRCSYLGLDGKPLRDPDQLRRIKSLVVPPGRLEVAARRGADPDIGPGRRDDQRLDPAQLVRVAQRLP